jgi:uncharacterized protein YpuA (DUF1002 family)
LAGEKCQTKKEDIMDIGQVTVKEILAKQLGEEKTAGVLKEINDAYQKGKRGDDLQEDFKDAVKREGLDPDDVQYQFIANSVLPSTY